jgi:hypothetical protein
VRASVDADTAKRFASAKAADQAKAPEGKAAEGKAPEGKASEAKALEVKAAEAKAPDPATEAAAINARTQAFDFQIPVYQYDQIYRPLQDLLAPVAQPNTAGPKEHK